MRRALVLAAACLLVGSAPAAAAGLPADAAIAAAPLHREEAAQAAGRQLVETAAQGRIDDAFALAARLRRPADSELASILAAQQAELTRDRPGYGALRRLDLIDTARFGSSFVRWYYDAVYANGRQRWQLTFRHRSDGWFLNGIVLGWTPERP